MDLLKIASRLASHDQDGDDFSQAQDLQEHDHDESPDNEFEEFEAHVTYPAGVNSDDAVQFAIDNLLDYATGNWEIVKNSENECTIKIMIDPEIANNTDLIGNGHLCRQSENGVTINIQV